MSGIQSVEIEVEKGGANIEAGDTCTGVITGSDTKQFTMSGDEVTYFELQIEEDGSGIEFTPDWPARITPGTGLGRLVQRFGETLSVGESVDLADVFEVGQKVQFEVGEEEASDDPDQTFLVVEEDSVRPEGDELDGGHGGSSTTVDSGSDDPDDPDDGGLRDEVLEVLDEREGDEEGDIKRDLAKMGGDHIRAYKDLKAEGEIEVEGDMAFLA